MSTLYVPLALAALGIVLRGAGFAFRKSIESLQARRAMGAAFAISSVLTPFFMGTVVGAIAAGNVPADGNGDAFSSWIAPLPLLVGALFVASGAYLAAVFLIADARRAARPTWSATSPAAPWSRRSSPGRSRSPGSSPSTPKPATSTTGSPTRRCRWCRSPALCGLGVLVLLLRGARGQALRPLAVARGRRRDLGLGRRPVPLPAADLAEDQPVGRARPDPRRGARRLRGRRGRRPAGPRRCSTGSASASCSRIDLMTGNAGAVLFDIDGTILVTGGAGGGRLAARLRGAATGSKPTSPSTPTPA